MGLSIELRSMRTSIALIAGAAVLVVFQGCSESEATGRAVAGSCTLDSDCNATLVCTFGRCHTQCATSKDCPNGARCVEAGGGGDASSGSQRVCELEGEDAGQGGGGNTGSGGASSGGSSGAGGTAGAGGASDAGPSSGGATGGAPTSTGGAVGDGSTSLPDGPIGYTSCPASPPVTTTLCRAGLQCTYGTDPRTSCRTVYDCIGENWQVGMPKCPVIPQCESLSTLPQTGAACPTVNDWCEFADHGACGCRLSPRQWVCASKPLFPCPAIAPNAGQPCDVSVTPRCDYGVCSSPVHSSAVCHDGVWRYDVVVCPV